MKLGKKKKAEPPKEHKYVVLWEGYDTSTYEWRTVVRELVTFAKAFYSLNDASCFAMSRHNGGRIMELGREWEAYVGALPKGD
jgi:hypothetical protein